MYLAGLVVLRCVMKWLERATHEALLPVRVFRDERLRMIEVDNSFYKDILDRCIDMQSNVLSKSNYLYRFFAPRARSDLRACGNATNPLLFYVDLFIGLIIAAQMVSIFCHCARKKSPPSFPSPPTPPDSPPPSDKSLKQQQTGPLRKRPVIVVEKNMDV